MAEPFAHSFIVNSVRKIEIKHSFSEAAPLYEYTATGPFRSEINFRATNLLPIGHVLTLLSDAPVA